MSPQPPASPWGTAPHTLQRAVVTLTMLAGELEGGRWERPAPSTPALPRAGGPKSPLPQAPDRPPARGLKQWAELSSDPGNELSGSCAHRFPRRFMNWPAPRLEMRFRVVVMSPLSTRSCS